MAISVVCSACQSKLNIPDNLAGKRAKCPKCQTPFQIPAAVDPLAPVAAPAPFGPHAPVAAPAPAPAATKAGVNPLIIAAAAGGGGLVLLVGLVVIIWLVSSGKPKKPQLAQANPAVAPTDGSIPPPTPPAAIPAPQTPQENYSPSVPPTPATTNPPANTPEAAPAGWIDFSDEAMGFSVAFPAPPGEDEVAADEKDDSVTASFKRDMLKSMKEKGNLRMVRATHQQRTYYAQATRLPLVGMSPDQYFDRMEMSIGALHPGFELVGKSQRGKHDGHRYSDFKLQQGDTQKIVRMIPAYGVVYGVVVEGKKVEATDNDVARFFTSLKLTAPKKAEPAPSAVIAKNDPPSNGEPTDPTEPTPPTNSKRPARPTPQPAAPVELPEPLGPPFAGKKTDFTICFPEKATVKTIDTFKAIEDAKRRNEVKGRWADDKVVFETLTAEIGGRTFMITAWRDRKLTGNDATNAQLRRIKDLLADQVKGNRPSIVNSDLLKKVPARSLYTRRYRADDKLIVYQEIREGTFACVVQVESPKDTDEKTDPQIWAFFNSLEVSAAAQ